MKKYFVAVLLLISIVRSAHGLIHPLEGTVIRQITNPWASQVGFGLANDGTNLYVTGATDGDIRVVDPNTLSVIRTIPTSASTILGLEYYNGIIYAAEPHPVYDEDAPSRIHVIDANSGMTLFSFDAPDESVVGLSMGGDGLLYAMDGYSSGSTDVYIYAFNPANGDLIDTIDASSTLIRYTDIIEWVGDLFLSDTTYDVLAFYELTDGSVEHSYNLPIVGGLPDQDFRGSTLMGDSLYVWSQVPASSNRYLTEIGLTPEPATILLLGLGAVILRKKH